VEHEGNAFETLKFNLIENRHGISYEWPNWLPEAPIGIRELVAEYGPELERLRGSVTLIAGGPPCQGFSSAGRRQNQRDPRNRLFRDYVEVARIIRPPLLFFENVPGFAVEFNKGERQRKNPRHVGRPAKPYSVRLVEELGHLGYQVFEFIEDSTLFGVPQIRHRYVIFGIQKELAQGLDEHALKTMIGHERLLFLQSLGLPDRPLSVRDAISDLETAGAELIACADTQGFEQLAYKGPRTDYQRLLRCGMNELDPPNSMRLVNHRVDTVDRFERILAECRKGVRLSPGDRVRLSIGKASITPLDGGRPASTITSLPDDFVHYSEPRVLTVRECARLQSFPDWFEFRGKYTTGSQSRRREVPRYTQVANAIPPFVAEVVGRVLLQLASRVDRGNQAEPIHRTAALNR
jgi:DNA (cytosine-5)-methyltransferase 1